MGNNTTKKEEKKRKQKKQMESIAKRILILKDEAQNPTPQETATDHKQNAKVLEKKKTQDQEEVIQKGINSKQSAELLQNLQKSLQSHCEVIMSFTKASTAQKGASKDVALKDNTNEMVNKAKPDKLWASFYEICCNMKTICEHHGINPSDLNIQQLLKMVENDRHEDKMQIQVMHHKSGTIAKKVGNELTVRLESRMGVQFKTCKNESEIECTQPLLVLCVAGTRIGSDATYSIQDIAREYYRNTALLIIHNKEEDSLPVKSSSDVLTDQEFKDLGGIFDFGYSKDMGIYGCEMNNKSFNDLTLFIARQAAEKC